jgi:hypothetical protein
VSGTGRDRGDAALRERTKDLIAERAEPLPEGDAGLIEAERRICELLDLSEYQADENPDDEAEWQASVVEVFRLDNLIAETEPKTFIGATVKLRRLLDPTIGIETWNEREILSLRQILAFMEREIEARWR